MDGTLADFSGALKRDLALISSPFEQEYFANLSPDDANDPPWLTERKKLIKRQPNWWYNLPKHQPGFHILELCKIIGYDIHVLTKGPRSNPDAWGQKVAWCKDIIPQYPVTISDDKGLVYGRVLVDDWPPYIQAWLEYRPRGTVIMPAHSWNKDFTHPQVIRYETPNDSARVSIALMNQFDRKLLNG